MSRTSGAEKQYVVAVFDLMFLTMQSLIISEAEEGITGQAVNCRIVKRELIFGSVPSLVLRPEPRGRELLYPSTLRQGGSVMAEA